MKLTGIAAWITVGGINYFIYFIKVLSHLLEPLLFFSLPALKQSVKQINSGIACWCIGINLTGEAK
ncbi:MAG: hypothetical protein ACXWTW_08120, partial [Methylobacter sp.]